MDKKGKWSLSPAYDMTFSVDMDAPSYVNRHELTVNGRDRNIVKDDLIKIAVDNDIQDYKIIIDKVADAVRNFSIYAKDQNINEELKGSIEKRLYEF